MDRFTTKQLKEWCKNYQKETWINRSRHQKYIRFLEEIAKRYK